MTTLPQDPESNAARIRELVQPMAGSCAGHSVFLVDADRTLTPDDTSRTFLRMAGLDPLPIKRRFQRDGYCFDAFRFHTQCHVELGEEAFELLAPQVAASAPLHPGALEFLRAAADRGPTFVVSAGIPAVWRHVLVEHDLGRIGVIGGIDPRVPFVLGRAEKGLVGRLFKSQCRVVVGVGDSDVDTELLQAAHHAVVVINHHQNQDLLPHLVDHPSLWQVAPIGAPHQGIPELDFPDVARLGSERPPCR